jgi:hypothetical protein
MDWKTLLAYITGTVDQELLLRNEYLVTENRLLRSHIKGHIRLSDGERKTLAEIGQKLGKQALQEVATIVKPDTILGWHRKLTVCLDATSLVVCSYGCDDGRIAPTHCGVIGAGRGDG